MRYPSPIQEAWPSGEEAIEMAIVWKNHLWKQSRPADPRQISALEETWGVKLPGEYKRILALHQGMVPEPCVFKVGRGNNVVGPLLTLNVERDLEYYSIARSYEIIKPHVPDRLFPFATTPGGEFLCFDYRNLPQEPGVVLVTVEMFIYPVASSFREFLEGLYEA